MPIRQPNSGVSPSASACSRIVAPVLGASWPDLLNATSPSAEVPEVRGGWKYSTLRASEPSYAARTASIIGAGPQAQVGTAR